MFIYQTRPQGRCLTTTGISEVEFLELAEKLKSGSLSCQPDNNHESCQSKISSMPSRTARIMSTTSPVCALVRPVRDVIELLQKMQQTPILSDAASLMLLQIVEQRNSSLKRIKSSLSYMNKENFMSHCSFYLLYRNYKKIHQL